MKIWIRAEKTLSNVGFWLQGEVCSQRRLFGTPRKSTFKMSPKWAKYEIRVKKYLSCQEAMLQIISSSISIELVIEHVL